MGHISNYLSSQCGSKSQEYNEVGWWLNHTGHCHKAHNWLTMKSCLEARNCKMTLFTNVSAKGKKRAQKEGFFEDYYKSLYKDIYKDLYYLNPYKIRT